MQTSALEARLPEKKNEVNPNHSARLPKLSSESKSKDEPDAGMSMVLDLSAGAVDKKNEFNQSTRAKNENQRSNSFRGSPDKERDEEMREGSEVGSEKENHGLNG